MHSGGSGDLRIIIIPKDGESVFFIISITINVCFGVEVTWTGACTTADSRLNRQSVGQVVFLNGHVDQCDCVLWLEQLSCRIE